MDEKSISSLAQNSSELFPAWVTREDINLSGESFCNMRDILWACGLDASHLFILREIDCTGKLPQSFKSQNRRENYTRSAFENSQTMITVVLTRSAS